MENPKKTEVEAVLEQRESIINVGERMVNDDLHALEAEKISMAKQIESLHADHKAIELEKASIAMRENQIHADRQAVEVEKAKLTERERILIIAEQKRDAGFANERALLNNELREKRNQAEAEISNSKEKRLSELDDEIAKLKNKRLDNVTYAENMERERICAEIAKDREAWINQQDDARKKFHAERTEFEKQKDALSAIQRDHADHQALELEKASITMRAKQVCSDRQAVEAEKAKLTERERILIIAEQKRDAGFANERALLNNELREKRNQAEAEISNSKEKRLSELDDEIAKLKNKRLDNVTYAENMERERICAEIAKDREAWINQQDDARKKFHAERTEFEKQKGALSALQSDIEGRKVELENAERILERKEQRLDQQWQKRHDQLQDDVEDHIGERLKSIEAAETNFKAENTRLREALSIQTELVSAFDQLKQQLGGRDPAEILFSLNSQADELKRLRVDLINRPTEEMRERYAALESLAKTQKTRAEELERQLATNEADVAEIGCLRRQSSELYAENKSLAQRASIFEGAASEAQVELNRLRAAYERPAEVEARYKEIRLPHISAEKAKQPVKSSDIDEMIWLNGIANASNTYGLHFNPRVLKAFHTALKTSEWSPLTVLAGVSGTGKSELPRLYSHFGGIYFEPLSVQPNWDSQESMLGFFNSIDNKFDAQPVLRFLAQSQQPWSDEYPGLQDAMCLVLLDEMNLAHPELYFAEFLSKFELRRGKKGNDLPFIPVKIGAGMKPYELSLGRNVLWTGTMNQDETTKSLSDKVLDRSIIINFPRPTELKRRLKLASLDEKNRGPALHKTSWQSWLANSSAFSDEEVKPFKEFIEKMNTSLSVTGRALGHRVWQSIEYYMSNYPDVRAARQKSDKDVFAKAMHIAFEDQLVQKVMPKLRGIDTRGKSKTECLDKIRAQILKGINDQSFNLVEDFDIACDLGYGQFIWQSANYLNASDTETNSEYVAVQVSEIKEEPPQL